MAVPEYTSLADARRHKLLLWMAGDEFGLLLDVIKAQVAAAMAEHTRVVLASPELHVRSDSQTPGEAEAIRRASEWQLIHDKLRSLQTMIADEDRSVPIGRLISVD